MFKRHLPCAVSVAVSVAVDVDVNDTVCSDQSTNNPHTG